MNLYTYDSSFEGFLSVIFQIYQRSQEPVSIQAIQQHQPSLLGNHIHVETEGTHAQRVYHSLTKKTEGKASMIYEAFLLESTDIQMTLYRVIKLIFQSGFKSTMLYDYTNPDILQLHQLTKKIHREVNRMHAFVRFEKSESGIYFSSIEPDFNVLPLIGDHFEKRYADQQWIIYDVKRNYGLFYNLKAVSLLITENISSSHDIKEQQDPEEKNYRKLWKTYFDSVNINERKNIRLHLQHLPRRYWKYLPEKNNAT